MKINKNQGMSLIETLVASVIVALVLLSMVGLATRIYSYIFLTKLKTFSFNIASENLEIMKTYNFGALKLTPDSMLPEPLSNLEDDDNPWENPSSEDNVITINTIRMKVYRWVQNATQDDNGNIVGKKQSDLPVSNLKLIKVVVTYDHPGPQGGMVTKQSVLETVISNAESAFGGVTIRGRVQKRDKANGNVDPPGFAAKGYVTVEGHPEYTAIIGTDSTDPHERGYYTIYGVMPGTYNLYAVGDGFESAVYADNPLVVNVSSGDINGVNFVCPKENPSSVSGIIYNTLGQPVDPADYKINGREIRADDGQSTTTTVNSTGHYTVENIDPDALTVSITAVFTEISTGQTFFGQYPSRINISGGIDVTGINITLQPITTGGIVRIKTLDARDRATIVQDVNLVFTDLGSGSITTLSSGGSGDVTAVLPALGNYTLAGSKTNYAPDQGILSISVTSFTPEQRLYFFPCGSVSGTIIEAVTGQPPVKSIGIQAFSDYKPVGSASSNTTTGQYQIDGVHTGSRNRIRIYVDGSSYELSNPENGVLEPVTVNFGATTANQNFTVITAYKPISGSLALSESILKDGVLIVAQPSSNTVAPHAYYLNNSDLVYRAQNSIRRELNPVYGVMAERNGTYKISVPGSDTYNIYAYYTKVSHPAGVIYRYYKVLNNIAPDTLNQNFSGSWNENY